ncbi:unnamed protein product [Rotaria socialis]|uniref:Replication stress response regulator SDE2 n=1 Tax=Rotaria socialis TaxID=392032 RepID=A0A820VX73_9BILA|nr:unnamed protein product [Rotaria socialis]
MNNLKVSSGYGRGNSVKEILQNSSNSYLSTPAPSMSINSNLNVASGRAAQVLRQIKQTSLVNFSKNLLENQLFIRCTVTQWHKYVVEFEPLITSRTTRFTMINHLSKTLGDLHKLYDGQFMYVPNPLSKEAFIFNNTKVNTPNEVRLKYSDTINIEEIPIDLINSLFRLAIDKGRESILNSMNRNNGYRQKVRYWNGNIVNIERKEDGILLTFDFAQKSSTTCYEELERFYMSTCGDDYRESARKELINKLVLTRYDNRTQRIDNIDFQLTPATLIINDEAKTTLIDYYLNRFDITIKDPDQPLLVYCPRRPGENTTNTEVNYLVPEFCYLTGLADRAHRDARARKTQNINVLDSAGRQNEISNFDDMIRRNMTTNKYLTLWGIDIVANTTQTHSIIDESYRKLSINDTALEDDEDNEHKDIVDNDYSYGHFTKPIALNNWLLIYPNIDEDRASTYVNMLRQVGQQQGMLINEPIHVKLDDDETATYANALRNNLNRQVQLVSIIVKSRRIDRYNTIKRICCIEIPTPTEIVLRSTIADDDILPSVALNIARDITVKLGGQIRPTNINISNFMIIGLATWTSEHVNYKSSEHFDYVLSIVGSLNNTMTEYFSHAKAYTNENDLRSDVASFVQLAVDAYYKQNKIYPTTLIIGRNVFSSFDDLNIIKENEIPSIIDLITNNSNIEDYEPRLIIFTFMKQMIYDSYKYVQPKKATNTDYFVANDSPSYCFYLSSHRDNCSTLQARQFLVLFDNTDLSAQKIQRLILYLTLHIPQRHHFFFPSTCRMHIQIGHQESINLSSLNTFGDVIQGLNDLLGENSYSIERNGKKIDLSAENQLLEDEIYKVWPKVLGGKRSSALRGQAGGFGSLLRSFGKQILISKNKEACRDLNGRRMRDVNNEKKLKEWMQKQLEKPATPSSDQKSKSSADEDQKDYRNVPPPHKFSDAAYDEQKKQIADDMDESVQIAAQLIQEEKRKKKKKSSTAISTNDDDDNDKKDNDDDEDVETIATTKKRRHSEDILEDGELKMKKTKKEKGASAAFFLGIDLGDVSTDDDDEDEPVASAKKKKVAKKI